MNIILRKSKIPTQAQTAYQISDDALAKGLRNGTIEEVEPGIYRETSAEYHYETKVMVPRIKARMQTKTMAQK